MSRKLQAPPFTAMGPVPADTAVLPSVSALVPAWNEAARIGACIQSLLAIAWPGLEILVSAGGGDGTYEVAQRYASDRVRVIEQRPGEGKQAALRNLLAIASGDVLYLTDGDSVIPEATFRAVLEPIVSGEVEVVTGTYRPYQQDIATPLIFYQRSIDRAVERRRGRNGDGICGVNAAVTRRALEVAGGFDPAVATGTDYHLARRLVAAGYQIRFVSAPVETEYPATAVAYLRRQSRWIRSSFLHGLATGDQGTVRSSVQTMAIGTSFVAFPFTWPVTRRYGAVLWAVMFTLLLMLRLNYAGDLADELDLPLSLEFLVRLPFLTLLDLVAWAMPVIDFCSEARRSRW